MKKINSLLEKARTLERPKNLHTEFQQFGIYLSEELDDPKHASLYIKLAKETPRAIISEALTFTKGYTQAKSKAKVFMWKLKDLKKGLS